MCGHRSPSWQPHQDAGWAACNSGHGTRASSRHIHTWPSTLTFTLCTCSIVVAQCCMIVCMLHDCLHAALTNVVAELMPFLINGHYLWFTFAGWRLSVTSKKQIHASLSLIGCSVRVCLPSWYTQLELAR